MSENAQEKSLNPFQSAGFIRHISLPIRQDTGCLGSLQRDIIRFMIWMEFSGKLRGIQTKYYLPRLHEGVFALPAYVEELVQDVE